MKPEILDVVKLIEDIPNENLNRGAVGTIVHESTAQEEAYLVEFCNKSGETLSEVFLLPTQFVLTKINH